MPPLILLRCQINMFAGGSQQGFSLAFCAFKVSVVGLNKQHDVFSVNCMLCCCQWGAGMQGWCCALL